MDGRFVESNCLAEGDEACTSRNKVLRLIPLTSSLLEHRKLRAQRKGGQNEGL
jgi:hypothetical protein